MHAFDVTDPKVIEAMAKAGGAAIIESKYSDATRDEQLSDRIVPCVIAKGRRSEVMTGRQAGRQAADRQARTCVISVIRAAVDEESEGSAYRLR